MDPASSGEEEERGGVEGRDEGARKGRLGSARTGGGNVQAWVVVHEPFGVPWQSPPFIWGPSTTRWIPPPATRGIWEDEPFPPQPWTIQTYVHVLFPHVPSDMTCPTHVFLLSITSVACPCATPAHNHTAQRWSTSMASPSPSCRTHLGVGSSFSFRTPPVPCGFERTRSRVPALSKGGSNPGQEGGRGRLRRHIRHFEASRSISWKGSTSPWPPSRTSLRTPSSKRTPNTSSPATRYVFRIRREGWRTARWTKKRRGLGEMQAARMDRHLRDACVGKLAKRWYRRAKHRGLDRSRERKTNVRW